jgi:hypothetical protein
MLLGLSLALALGCDDGDTAAEPTADSGSGKADGAKAEQPPATAAKVDAPAAEPPAKEASEQPAAAVTEGSIRANIGGAELEFSHLPADSNYVMQTNMGVMGHTEPGGPSIKIMAMHRTLGPDTEYPTELRSATAEEQQTMLKEHKAALKAGTQSRIGAMPNVAMIYTDAAGKEYFDMNFVLTVSEFDGKRLKGTFGEGALRPKKAKDASQNLAVSGGSIDVVVKVPAAGLMVEKAVGAGK